MAETSVVAFPGSPKPSALKLPRLDLERLFGSQGTTLATVQQAQTVLVEARRRSPGCSTATSPRPRPGRRWPSGSRRRRPC